jgi:16S rRNA processing protein RimM
VARIEGVSDRSAAESLRGSLIEVDRSALPALQDGEYYHVDLIGLPALNSEGREFGTVSSIENYGAGDLLEIEDETGRKSLIPFRDGIADLEDDRIIIDPEFLA